MAIDLRSGTARVAIDAEDGGRIGQITIDGSALLRGRQDSASEWSDWGSYPLSPWCNRVPDGRIDAGGSLGSVPINWDDGSAIHGLTADVPWEVVDSSRSSDRVALRCHREVGPYDVESEQSFELAPTHLDQMLRVANCGAAPVPVGLGIHPWFAVAPIEVPADQMWPGDGPMPTGPPIAVDPLHDLRTPRLAPPMDRCFTGLTGSTARIGHLALHWRGPITQVVVYSGSPGWVCVEPVTMANDGFGLARRGIENHGVRRLEPGESLEVHYRFDWAGVGMMKGGGSLCA